MSVGNIFAEGKTSIEKALDHMKTEVEKLVASSGNELQKLKDELSHVAEERDEWKKKYDEANNKLVHIQDQLQEQAKKLEEMSHDKNKQIDMLELLDIYLLMINNVFESTSHVRLLVMLHGEKEEYSLEDLAKASGIGALEVRKAIFELRNADVIEFDEETEMVKLKKRFI